MKASAVDIVPDSERRGFIGALPPPLRPFASLMRLDRPIGTWLLYWPCAWSVALAGVGGRWDLFAWLALGAFAMRSAGCVYNDIVDRELDRSVERTRLRPLASRRVSLRSAWLLIGSLCLVGLVVLLQLNRVAALVAIASIAPVAAYPFMKRITWWPQAWLGIVFSWGALVGWAAVTRTASTGRRFCCGRLRRLVIGYDTIYAMQDKEDDALVGVKSSALRLGARAPLGNRDLLFRGASLLGGGNLGRATAMACAGGLASSRRPPRQSGAARRARRAAPDWRGGRRLEARPPAQAIAVARPRLPPPKREARE